MLVEEPRLRWVRTQLLGRAPGFSPGPPVVGPYRPVTLVTGPRAGARLRAWLEGTTGVVEVDGGGASSSPTSSCGGRTPTAPRGSTTCASTAR